MNCSRKGGDVLIIKGHNFGQSFASVFIGLDSCDNVVHSMLYLFLLLSHYIIIISSSFYLPIISHSLTD
jgi:hypothetical protein